MGNKKISSTAFALFLSVGALAFSIGSTLILKNIFEKKDFYLNKEISQKKELIYERPETHYNHPIDPRGFLGIENYNHSLEELSKKQ